MLPLPDGGQALAVRAQCGGAECGRASWLGPNVDVVAISRQISASPLRFAPITNTSIILQPTVFSGLSDEKCGVQDPRVTYDAATRTYYMTYTCWDCKVRAPPDIHAARKARWECGGPQAPQES